MVEIFNCYEAIYYFKLMNGLYVNDNNIMLTVMHVRIQKLKSVYRTGFIICTYDGNCNKKSVNYWQFFILTALTVKTTVLLDVMSHRLLDIVACIAVAMQRLQHGRIHQGHFWATAR
jgi:hypothetical protein